jgi:hypothetical protein
MNKKKTKKNVKIPLRYIPKYLTKKDYKKQKQNINKSRKLYKKGIYFARPKVKSFVSKKSNYVTIAKKMYNVNSIDASNELSRKTGCSKNALEKIIKKGEGAYYSSGSRPNQTPQSWGKARLASALVSGKAALIDFNILVNGCKIGSKGWKSAKKAKKLYS